MSDLFKSLKFYASKTGISDKNFVEDLGFTNKFRVLADEEDYPPLIVVERGKVTVQ